MKAALNGVPQLGTEDGWWEEGFDGRNGWSIPRAPEGADPEEVDAHDAEHAFRLLENEIVPRFYERSLDGLPIAWIETMRGAIAAAGRRFTARRMVQEYVRDYYAPALSAPVSAPSSLESDTTISST